MNQIIYLSEDENKALALFSEGFSTRHINENCRVPLSGMGVFTLEIKRKTGIRDLRDTTECRVYREKHLAAITGDGPTKDQTFALRYLLNDHTLRGIGHQLSINEEETEKLIDDACKACGIFTRDERARRSQMRLYLAIFRPNGSPLSPMEEQILRLMAEGLSFIEIGDRLTALQGFIVAKAREACTRLGFDAKGRNAQRNLLRAYFAYFDAQKAAEIDMSDPAF